MKTEGIAVIRSIHRIFHEYDSGFRASPNRGLWSNTTAPRTFVEVDVRQREYGRVWAWWRRLAGLVSRWNGRQPKIFRLRQSPTWQLQPEIGHDRLGLGAYEFAGKYRLWQAAEKLSHVSGGLGMSCRPAMRAKVWAMVISSCSISRFQLGRH